MEFHAVVVAVACVGFPKQSHVLCGFSKRIGILITDVFGKFGVRAHCRDSLERKVCILFAGALEVVGTELVAGILAVFAAIFGPCTQYLDIRFEPFAVAGNAADGVGKDYHVGGFLERHGIAVVHAVGLRIDTEVVCGTVFTGAFGRKSIIEDGKHHTLL